MRVFDLKTGESVFNTESTHFLSSVQVFDLKTGESVYNTESTHFLSSVQVTYFTKGSHGSTGTFHYKYKW